MLFRPKKRIYIISSELEFYPVIGGINTFLRVILSELLQTKILVDNNIEFVFLGIQVGRSSPIRIMMAAGGKNRFYARRISSNNWR